ncbi:hypothetical protein GGX14DRAFT_588277 [Mycena pura]|uniref:Peptidase S53 activation domain-containing protein n=1 Tax=Mycena pura TaxID=153505 RepID=A0AAD6US90_9AGAR|nr:hypothetical protein GGX14DRAFT_588277 [Mycena pura]
MPFLAAIRVVLAASAAGHSGRAMAVHHTRDARAPGFVVLASHQQRPSVGCASLKLNDNAGLEIDRPDPASARYGQFLTNEEIQRRVDSFSTPKDETIAVVNGWKNNIEAATISPSGDMLQISIPVPRANELLRTQFGISGFTHYYTYRERDYVHPTTTFTPPCPVRPKFSAIKSKRGTVQEDAREMNQRATGTRSRRAAQAGLHRRRAYNLSVSHDVQVAESWVSDDGIQEFLTIAESSSTTFATTSVDGGTNMQNLSLTGEEAVRTFFNCWIVLLHDIMLTVWHLYSMGLATGVPVVFGEHITDASPASSTSLAP